jgi:hypothetical protein
MSKELPFFKFDPTEWIMGKISYQPLEVQGAFIQCCSYFWKKSGVLKIDEIDWRIGKKNLEILIDNDFLSVKDGFLSIEFLEEQLLTFESIRIKRAENGSKGGVAKATKNLANATENLAGVKQNVADIRVKSKDININIILNNSLLSEIKISDDKKFFLFKDLKLEVTEDQIGYFKSALAFQNLIIKNLREKSSPTTQIENAKFKSFVDPIRLMFEKDKVTKSQLIDAYNYLNSPEGEFWKSNILSTVKLREKLPVLLAKKNTKTTIEAKKEVLVPNPRKRGQF